MRADPAIARDFAGLGTQLGGRIAALARADENGCRAARVSEARGFDQDIL